MARQREWRSSLRWPAVPSLHRAKTPTCVVRVRVTRELPWVRLVPPRQRAERQNRSVRARSPPPVDESRECGAGAVGVGRETRNPAYGSVPVTFPPALLTGQSFFQFGTPAFEHSLV